MKKIYIIIGVLIFLLVVGVWAYLFTYGTSGADGVFAQFGAGKDSDNPAPVQEPTYVDVSDVETATGAPQALKQLTTRPVAGAGFVEGGIRYVERGTGHVYQIDLFSGTESLVSGTTIPGTQTALFSPDGTYAAVTTFDGGVSKTLVGMISSTDFSGESLPTGAENIFFTNASGTLSYTLSSNTGTVGYSYNLERKVGTQVFAIPLRDVRVVWGNPVYVYTTPSAHQTGYVYRIEKSTPMYVTEGKKGLSALNTGQKLIVTWDSDTLVRSGVQDDAGLTTLQLPIIPEKCALTEFTLYCGIPNTRVDVGTFPDNWYKGIVSYSDELYVTSLATGNDPILLVDLLATSGREIDILKMGVDMKEELLYFINKNDDSLWMYDTRLTQTQE